MKKPKKDDVAWRYGAASSAKFQYKLQYKLLTN
jgi:hypothetical protein